MEDLQFQLEEQGIISGDKIEVVEEGTQKILSDLEDRLTKEKEESTRLREQLAQSQQQQNGPLPSSGVS